MNISSKFFVELPIFYNNLTLGNFEYSKFKNLNNTEGKTIIVNLCEEKITTVNSNVIICNLKLADSYNQPYWYFKKVMIDCIKIMHYAKNNKHSLIVNCAAGINRSCSAIVAFAISNGISVDIAINYIKTCKKNKYSSDIWPTLMNKQFIFYLKQLENDRKK